MRFAVLSDTHYVSEEMLLGEGNEAKRLRHDINKAAFQALGEQRGLDTILITGDLTDDGDEYSHREYARLLRSLQEAGKKVYVLTATHDFHFSRAYTMKRGWPVRYRAYPWERPWFDKDRCDYKRLVTDEFSHLSAEECVPPLVRVPTADDLWELYREFGRDQAFSTCDSAYSYCVKLEEKLWCLMLNNNFRDVDASEDMSVGYSPDCYRWIKGLADRAKAEGAFLFACTHHPLVPPVPAYKIGGGTRNMRNSSSVHTLADIGIPLVFSGHTHFSDIAFASSDAGNVLCDVTTPSLCFLPPAYRIAEIFPEERRLKVISVPVEKTPEMNVNAPTLKEHFINEFVEEYREKMKKLPHGLGNIVLNMKVRHLYPLCPGTLNRAQYEEIRDRRIFDLIMDLVINMQCGDGQYTPDTAVYRFMMGLAAAADSLIETQPFIDVHKKLLGYTISQIMEPMLFNNYVPDGSADFVFDRLPAPNTVPPAIGSRLGDVVMGLLSAFALLLIPVSPVLTAAALPAMTLLKKAKLKKHPPTPERY